MAVKTIAIIPAAGMGIRMGLGIPKQFLLIRNTPILALSLWFFNNQMM